MKINWNAFNIAPTIVLAAIIASYAENGAKVEFPQNCKYLIGENGSFYKKIQIIEIKNDSIKHEVYKLWQGEIIPVGANKEFPLEFKNYKIDSANNFALYKMNGKLVFKNLKANLEANVQCSDTLPALYNKRRNMGQRFSARNYFGECHKYLKNAVYIFDASVHDIDLNLEFKEYEVKLIAKIDSLNKIYVAPTK